MAFEVPTDLIRQVQSALRKENGLFSYNPYDPTLPPLPPIADLDPSPPSLRCNNCKGRLLSGIQSLICVYCGKQQKRDVLPEPIAFNSTFGYRFLLESLGLDGSETIGLDLEESETNRGQSALKDEISLSNLLDLHIQWSDEPEKFETSLKLAEGESSVTLTGVDLDNSFRGSNSDTVFNAFQEQPVTTKQFKTIESKEVTGQDNLNLFQNVPVASGSDFSGWEASFLSADNQNQDGSLKSAEPFVTSTLGLTSHIDSVFGVGENLKDGKPNDDPVPAPSVVDSTVDLTAHIDSFFGGGEILKDGKPNEDPVPVLSMVSNTVDQTAHIDSVFGGGENLKDGQPNDDPVLAPSMINNWTEDDLWNNVSSAVSQPLDSAAKDEEGRSLDIVNDPSSDNVDWFQDIVNVPSLPFDSAVRDDSLNNPSSESVDWFQDNQWQTNVVSVPVDKNVNSAAFQPFDLAVKDNIVPDPSSESVDWFQENQWQMNSTNVPDHKTVNEGEDSFDEWNDFTSSSYAQAPSAAVSEQISDINMFSQSSANFQEVDFGSFVSEGPNSDRNADSKSNGAKDVDNFSAILQPKDDAEILMSQMHDLSFMLENNLSIPPKLEAVGSITDD